MKIRGFEYSEDTTLKELFKDLKMKGELENFSEETKKPNKKIMVQDIIDEIEED